jgi:erythromycin esterase-like protein
VQLTQAALRAGEDPVTAAQRGILTIWSNAKEVKPLFDYVKATQGSTRPLEMVGMDMQASAPGTDERFAADLQSFATALRDSRRRGDLAGLAARTIAAYGELLAHGRAREQKATESSKSGLTGKAFADAMRAWEQAEGVRQRPTRGTLDRFLAAVDRLLTAIRADRAALEEVHGTRDVALMEREVENLRGRGATAYDNERADRPADNAWTNDVWNRRDALMAGNLRWLIEQGYPGRKVIVWAHSVHVMTAYWAGKGGEWRSVQSDPQPDGRKPAGAFLAEWLKDRQYTIAMTTYQGEEGWANFQQQGPIPPAPEGSLESRLHGLGSPNVFLDLRSARLDKGGPFRAPQVVRIGVGPALPIEPVSDLPTAFDGVFYIDRMAPATPICRGPCAPEPPSAR